MPFATPTPRSERAVGIAALTLQQLVTHATVKAVLTAAVNPGVEALRAYKPGYEPPVEAILKSRKVAIPLVAATVVVPERVLLPGPVPIATVTLSAKLGMVVPDESCAAT